MIARDPDDLRDARVDAAWRAASREEPPAALDEAIRAAARRAIGTGPHLADTRKGATADSLRPQRWWWPLAAAATIGAIAIGLLQLTEPERVGVAGADKAVVSDTPTASGGAKRQEATAPGVPAAPVEEQAQGKPAMPVQASRPAPPPRAARESTVPAPRPVAPGALRTDAAVPFPRDEGAAKDVAKPPDAESRQADAATPPPRAEPFPAAAVKRESKEAAMRDVAPAPSAPPATPAAEASASGVTQGKLATAPGREAQRATAEAASTAQSELPAGRTQPAEDTRGLASAATPKALATSAARAKAAPKLSVPDWIALIRKLRDEGRIDDAAKELAAFRSAHTDHEQLLPPDLREWKPAQ